MQRSALVVRRRGRGLSAEGPGFYVWDTDLRSALGWARALDDASPPREARGPYGAGGSAGGAAPTASGDTP
jgi:hypothetical protein